MAWSIQDAFRGEEAAVMGPVLSGSNDPAARERYAAWLDVYDPVRAEAMRASDRLAEHPDDATLRERLAVLLPRVDATWFELVCKPTPIRHCGAAANEPSRVRFAFQCPRTWETLAPTADANVRDCSACQRKVHMCPTADEAASRARAGECISVPRPLARSIADGLTRYVTGRPDVLGMWAKTIFE